MKYYKKQFYFVGTRHGASLRGVGFWMGFMIIAIFVGTMCTSSLHLMKYCDSGMDFLIAMEF